VSIEVLANNVQAILQHSNTTRDMFRDLEVKVTSLTSDNTMLKQQIAQLETQIQAIQVKVYTGGSTNAT